MADTKDQTDLVCSASDTVADRSTREVVRPIRLRSASRQSMRGPRDQRAGLDGRRSSIESNRCECGYVGRASREAFHDAGRMSVLGRRELRDAQREREQRDVGSSATRATRPCAMGRHRRRREQQRTRRNRATHDRRATTSERRALLWRRSSPHAAHAAGSTGCTHCTLRVDCS